MDPTDPLSLLVPLLGIALILLAVWLTGGARRARLDRALVLARLGEDLPDFAAGEMAIAADGGSAIVADAGGALALVFAAGDKVVVRTLERGGARRVTVEGELLTLDTGDFTHGRFALRLPGEAARWAARLAPRERAA